MRKIVFAAFAMLGVSAANAQSVTCQQFGSLTNCQGFVNGHAYSSGSQTFGNLTHGSDTLGNQWSTQRYGNQTNTQIVPGNRW